MVEREVREPKTKAERIVQERFKGKTAAERQSIIAEFKAAMDAAQAKVDALKANKP